LWKLLGWAQAWEQVNDPDVGGEMRGEAFLDLLKRAGFSEDVAQTAASERAWQRMNKDLPP